MIRRAGRLVLCLAAALAPPAAAADCDPVASACAYEIGSGSYVARLPDGAGPFPAVVFLHGVGGTGEQTMRDVDLVENVVKRGYVFIAPTGQPRTLGRSGGTWNSRARFGAGERDDVAFLASVFDDAALRLDVDRGQILLGGFSNGAMMVWRMACDAPATAAAYAPVSGLLWRPLPDSCAGPAKLLHTHGWTDEVVPMEGRSIRNGAAVQGNLFVGLKLLRDAFGCAFDQPDEAWLRDGFWRRAWTACAPGARLEFALHPGGHLIPKGWMDLALDWFESVTEDARKIQ